MNTRTRNEKTFGQWEILPAGGRRYWRDVSGHNGWKARYVKEVGQEEETVRFFQEIYDNMGHIVEVHEKFPKDKGHKRIKEGGDRL
jgi:hypothetical protein